MGSHQITKGSIHGHASAVVCIYLLFLSYYYLNLSVFGEVIFSIWYIHAGWFLLVIPLVLFSIRDYGSHALRSIRTGRVLILLLLSYFIVRIILLADPEVKRYYIAGFLAAVAMGFLLGWIFNFSPRKDVQPCTCMHDAKCSIPLSWMAAFLVFPVLVLLYAYFIYSSLPAGLWTMGKPYAYQSFSDFLALSYICYVGGLLRFVYPRMPRARNGLFWFFNGILLCLVLLVLQFMSGAKAGGMVFLYFVIVLFCLSENKGALLRVIRFPVYILLLVWFLLVLSGAPAKMPTIFSHWIPIPGLGNLMTRIDIIKESGVPQILYNPLWGDLSVDRIITGEPGWYIHSIVSVQTHLGIFGSILLFGYIVYGICLLRATRNPIVKSMFLSVLVMAFLSSFIIWLPLWFALGAVFSQEWRRKEPWKEDPANAAVFDGSEGESSCAHSAAAPPVSGTTMADGASVPGS